MQWILVTENYRLIVRANLTMTEPSAIQKILTMRFPPAANNRSERCGIVLSTRTAEPLTPMDEIVGNLPRGYLVADTAVLMSPFNATKSTDL
jgi:hypothetical protein